MKTPKKQRIILAELSMSGVFHTTVNAGFIRWMRREHPTAELCFSAERSHLESCAEQIGNQSVHMIKWPFFPLANKYTLPLRDALGCAYALWLFLRSRKDDILFITNLLPVTHWAVFGLNALFRRRLSIALHGQLEALLPGVPLGLTKPYFRAIRLILRRDTSTRYVILGEPIRREGARFFSPAARLTVMDHPYAIDTETVENPLEFPIRFGQIGVGNRGKGTHRLFQLGEVLREEIEAGKVSLSLVGRLDPELRKAANPWVWWHEKPLPEAAWRHEIANCITRCCCGTTGRDGRRRAVRFSRR